MGPLEVLVVLIIALVIFGPKRVPELGKSLGKGVRNFRSALEGEDAEEEAGQDNAEPVRLPPVDEMAAEAANDEATVGAGADERSLEGEGRRERG